MPRDHRTYIAVHDGMPDHPKVEGLSDRAFRAMVELWCWSSRNLTDGHIPEGTWRKRVPTRARTELLSAGLFQPVDGGVVAHDYLQHQRSREQVDTFRRARRDSSAMANHVRWHAGKGVLQPDCSICCPGGDPADSDPDTIRIPDGARHGSVATSAQPPSTVRSGSVDGSGSDPSSGPSTSPEADTPSSLRSEGGAAEHAADPSDARCAKHVGWPDPPACGACRAARLRAERAEAHSAAEANRAPTYAAPACPDHPQHTAGRCPPCAADAEQARLSGLSWRDRVAQLSTSTATHDEPSDDEEAWESHLAALADANAQEYLDEQHSLSLSSAS